MCRLSGIVLYRARRASQQIGGWGVGGVTKQHQTAQKVDKLNCCAILELCEGNGADTQRRFYVVRKQDPHVDRASVTQ